MIHTHCSIDVMITVSIGITEFLFHVLFVTLPPVFWKQYIDMVQILLHYLRADRENDWSLHLSFLREMLPLMSIYDHTNYISVYLIDML